MASGMQTRESGIFTQRKMYKPENRPVITRLRKVYGYNSLAINKTTIYRGVKIQLFRPVELACLMLSTKEPQLQVLKTEQV